MAVKRVFRTVLGFLLLGAGGAMLLLPGPGWLTIFLGLGLLAREFDWARRWLDGLKSTAAEVTSRVTGRGKRRGNEAPRKNL